MESRLVVYYRNAMSRCVWLIAFFGIGVHWAIGRLALAYGANSWAVVGAKNLLSFGAVAALFLFAERAYRTHLWKLVYPELDFSGVWKGSTTYERRQIPVNGATAEFVPFEAPNDVLLKQDCFSISVLPTVSPTQTGSWRSLVAGLGEGPSVRYAYLVDYGGKEGFPHEAIGYETLSVVGPEEGSRPRRLSGSFSHCARGQAPVYSGSVAFELRGGSRKSKRIFNWFLKAVAYLGKPGVDAT